MREPRAAIGWRLPGESAALTTVSVCDERKIMRGHQLAEVSVFGLVSSRVASEKGLAVPSDTAVLASKWDVNGL